MAASNFLVFVYSNGEKVQNSKDMEIILKTMSVSADGNDNGLTISESSGKFNFNSKVLGGIGAATGAGEAVEYNQLTTALSDYIPLTQKGAANGVASLGADSKIPSAQLPALAITSVSVAADEVAHLALADQEEGDVVVRSDEGKTYIHNGGTAGDMTDWTELVAPGVGVTSVNGDAGPSVVLDTDDIDEGSTNLYYTGARFDTAFAAKDTGDLAEGANLYYTEARFDTAFAAKDTDDLGEGSTNLYFTDARFDTRLAAKDTDDLAEGDNLYFTDERAQAAAGIVETYGNEQGAEITVRQIGVLDASGDVVLAQANQSLGKGNHFVMVKDAQIADGAAGDFYAPGKGTKVAGFTGLTQNAPVYLSRSAAGGYTQSLAGFVSGEHVVLIGHATSTTEMVFDPSYEFSFA